MERHFTDSRYREGPDISCSMDPVGLRSLIDISKEIHASLKNPKERTAEEEDVYKFARSSITADLDINEGDVITEGNIWPRRPGTGEIPGFDFYKIIGKTALQKIPKGEFIRWADLG